MGIYGCTDFLLTDRNGDCVVGRSMEFAPDLKSEIFVQAGRGQNCQSMIGQKKAFSWQQKYAILGINVFGNNQFVVDGMNGQGLSVEYLWFPGAKYPELVPGKMNNTINLYDVGSWLLGTCATVAEVEAKLKGVFVFAPGFSGGDLSGVLPLHLSIHDRKGNSLVVEFIDGQMKIMRNKVGVLTNSPSFDWHVTNLNNYVGLSGMDRNPDKFGGLALSPTGQGSGLSGLPGGYTPPARFVRIAFLKLFADVARDAEKNKNLAWHLLNTVDIPYGVIKTSDGHIGDFTQWAIVKDLKNGILFYRTYDNLIPQMQSLSDALNTGMANIPLRAQ